jgi:hypothetical protein
MPDVNVTLRFTGGHVLQTNPLLIVLPCDPTEYTELSTGGLPDSNFEIRGKPGSSCNCGAIPDRACNHAGIDSFQVRITNYNTAGMILANKVLEVQMTNPIWPKILFPDPENGMVIWFNVQPPGKTYSPPHEEQEPESRGGGILEQPRKEIKP